MSRVGSSVIQLPASVSLKMVGKKLEVKGKSGSLSFELPSVIKLIQEDQSIRFEPLNKEKATRMLWGTVQRRVAAMVKGVDDGFSINLTLVGVGYRAAVQGSEVVMNLGYSHEIRYPLPEGISVRSEKPTSLTVCGVDKQLVGQVAAEIRSYRLPEPYKGKGIIREGEVVIRKEGKKK